MEYAEKMEYEAQARHHLMQGEPQMATVYAILHLANIARDINNMFASILNELERMTVPQPVLEKHITSLEKFLAQEKERKEH